jgi:hypothetical protein
MGGFDTNSLININLADIKTQNTTREHSLTKRSIDSNCPKGDASMIDVRDMFNEAYKINKDDSIPGYKIKAHHFDHN